MTKSKKMLAIIIALIVMLFVSSGALIAVLVAGNQKAQSKVHVRYTSSDVNVKVEAKYYVGITGTDMIDKNNNDQTYLELNANKTNGSLDQPSTEVALNKVNSTIIYEYKFTNLSDRIPAKISQLVEDGNIVVPKDSNNNVKLTYTSSSTSLGASATSNSTTLNTQGLPASSTRYVYVIVSIVELLDNVDFKGEFGWDLAKGEALTTDSVSGSQSIVVDTSDEKLYNKSAMNNLQLVVGVENTEPNYPMIQDKYFEGWYSDSGYNNKVEFPIIPTIDTKLYPKHETATSDLEYTYTNNAYMVKAGDEQTFTAGYTGSATNIYIADAYSNGTNGLLPVTAIGKCAFVQKTEVTSITLPRSITTIGMAAFGSCLALASVNIPEGVTSIESFAFSADSALTSINLPYGITTIEESLFYVCSGLKSVSIPVGVTSIGDSAFNECNALTSIVIPEGVTSIGNDAFVNCYSMTSLTLPDSLVSIGDSAFAVCSLIDSLYIPRGVTSIGEEAFSLCSFNGITVSPDNSVYRSEGNCLIQQSNNKVVLGCKNSRIPNSVTSIGDSSFDSCSGLTNITIPSSVKSIGDSAFDGCEDLVNVTIYNGVTDIGGSAFGFCPLLASIVIPNSVTQLGSSAFSGCSNLTSVTIGSGVKKIDFGAFANCSKLTSAIFVNTTGWTVMSYNATTGDAVTLSTTDFAANATLLTTTHQNKCWNRV